MKWFNMFLPCVIESPVQVCLPRSIGQKVMIHLDPANCGQITYTGIQGIYKLFNDTLVSSQVHFNHLYKYVCLKNIGQNGVIQ